MIVAQMQLRGFFIARNFSQVKWNEAKRSTLEHYFHLLSEKDKMNDIRPLQNNSFRFRSLLDGAMCRGKIIDCYDTATAQAHLFRGSSSSVFATHLTNSASNFASFILYKNFSYRLQNYCGKGCQHNIIVHASIYLTTIACLSLSWVQASF